MDLLGFLVWFTSEYGLLGVFMERVSVVCGLIFSSPWLEVLG